jgi:hypothetical protein
MEAGATAPFRASVQFWRCPKYRACKGRWPFSLYKRERCLYHAERNQNAMLRQEMNDAMPEKDPSSFTALQYLGVLAISAWGGVVSFIIKVRNGDSKAYNIVEMVGEIAISAFAGLLSFFACEAIGMSQLWTAVVVGVSGHMGTRAIFILESILEKKLAPFLPEK